MKQLRIKSLIANDLYSFGPGVPCPFNYAGDPKILILGVNNDEEGADSNGSGKSSIPNIIYWIIFGEIFQAKENTDDIIRRGKKNGSGTLTLIDEQNKELVIERGRGKGKHKFLKVAYDSDTKYTCNTDTETQKELFKLLNISLFLKPAEYTNDFINTCYFSSDIIKGFMAKETNDQEFLEYIIKALVDQPEDVKVERRVDEMGVLLSLKVNPEDMGQIIGRSGATARAIRSLVRIVGLKNHARVNLKIEEPVGGKTTQDKKASSEVLEDLKL